MVLFVLLYMCLLTHCLLVMSEVGIYDSDTYHFFFFFGRQGRGGKILNKIHRPKGKKDIY